MKVSVVIADKAFWEVLTTYRYATVCTVYSVQIPIYTTFLAIGLEYKILQFVWYLRVLQFPSPNRFVWKFCKQYGFSAPCAHLVLIENLPDGQYLYSIIIISAVCNGREYLIKCVCIIHKGLK